MSNKSRELAKNVGLFAISGFLPKLFSFVLVPILTSYLSTEDYGVFDLLQTTVTLLIPILTLGIQDAVIRFVLDKEHENSIVFSVATRIFIVGSIVLGALLLVLYQCGAVTADKYLLIYLWISYNLAAFGNILSLFCRGIDRIRTLTISSILSSALSLTLSIVFLVVLRWGFYGFLVANVTAQLVAIVYTSASINALGYVEYGKLPSATTRAMVRYSGPLILNNLAWWVTSASDRYMIALILGASDNGLYAVAGKIPGMLTVFQNVYSQAWTISAIKEFDSQDTDGFIGANYSRFSALMALVCSLLIIANKTISQVLFSKSFYSAWLFVPPLLVAVFFNAMSLFMGSIFVAVKNTRVIATTTVVGAIVNVAGNVLLIRLIGVYGAALSTAIGHSVVLLMRHTYARQHIKMKLNWVTELLTYLLLLVQMIIATIEQSWLWVQILLFFGLMLMNGKMILSAVSKVKQLLFSKRI